MPNITYAVIRDGDKVWGQAGSMKVKNIIKRHYPLSYRYRNAIQQIGTLTVIANLDNIHQDIITQAAIILASNAFKTFLVAAFMLLFFHKQVNRFLCVITNYLHNLDIQEFSKPLSLPQIGRAHV